MSNAENRSSFPWGHLVGAGLAIGGIGLTVGYDIGSGRWQLSLPFSPQEMKPSPQVLSSPETRQLTSALLTRYLDIKKRYESILNEQLSLDGLRFGTLSVTTEVKKAARQHLVDGLYLAQTVGVSGIDIDARNGRVAYLNHEFDLNKPLQFHVLAGLVELALTSQQNELSLQDNQDKVKRLVDQGSSQWYIDQTDQTKKIKAEEIKNQRIVGNLLWLLDRDVPITIEIEDDAFPFLPVTNLNIASQTLQALDRAGFPFPRQIKYIKYYQGAPGTGWYQGHAQKDPFTTVITNNSAEETVVHEIGHFLSDAVYLDPDNPKLQAASQSEFDRQMKNIFGDQDMTGYIAKDTREKPSLTEEYAANFEEYLRRGVQFRRRNQSSLETVSDPSPIKQKISKFEYDFVKNLLDEEYTEGEVLVRQYNIGSSVYIRDEDKEDPGILLRRSPQDGLDPSLPAVWNGGEVEIVGGPLDIPDKLGNYRRLWQVQIRWSGNKGSVLSVDYYGKIGWIPEEFLGEQSP